MLLFLMDEDSAHMPARLAIGRGRLCHRVSHGGVEQLPFFCHGRGCERKYVERSATMGVPTAHHRVEAPTQRLLVGTDPELCTAYHAAVHTPERARDASKLQVYHLHLQSRNDVSPLMTSNGISISVTADIHTGQVNPRIVYFLL